MDRRHFIKKLGISSLGVAGAGALGSQFVQAAQTTREITREEFDALKNNYEKLDGRTKLMIRGMLVLLGLDILLI